ncbi:hypothetical protein CXG81DRAFT_14837 [Caulochytrium protostelioides]|uniref:Uncharacterized protein n=1 Tax=Caulochytrium protostelioides TaxID=1555241 RepID=A0A4P9X0D5_9FUNG|nr:hypothetical protein CXG81DRAFT_14837 [Caulochytrium protostelioides]|eukprot:RKO99201.1 hypothetical protein CXG81DRAFT_14837 [Caulochytrium protostelioides]
MSIGNPHDTLAVFGRQVPRWKVGYYVLGMYAGIYGMAKLYGSFQSAPARVFESPEQEQFVRRYVEFAEGESKKPLQVRRDFQG